MQYFRCGDTIRFLPHALTRRLKVVGRYAKVLSGTASTGFVKVHTPTPEGLIPFWFPPEALKNATPTDGRPPVGCRVTFLHTGLNPDAGLVGKTGTVKRNRPRSAYSHVELDDGKEVCAYYTEIERIPQCQEKS